MLVFLLTHFKTSERYWAEANEWANLKISISYIYKFWQRGKYLKPYLQNIANFPQVVISYYLYFWNDVNWNLKNTYCLIKEVL